VLIFQIRLILSLITTDAVATGTSCLSENVRFAGTATPLGSEVGREIYIYVMRILEKDLNHF